MKYSLFYLLFICSQLAIAQVDFSDLAYDSTQVLQNEAGTVYQKTFYQQAERVMIKQYAKGASLEEFGLSRNFSYDSVIVHFGKSNYICLFNKGGNSKRIYQWNQYDNVLSNRTYNKEGKEISRLVDIRYPTLYSLYPSAWHKGKYIDQKIGIIAGEPQVIEDYTLGKRYYHRKERVDESVHPDILALKEKAEATLGLYFHKKFIKNHVVWNLSRSGFHKKGYNMFSGRKEPHLGTGTALFFYSPEKHKLSAVDFAFDVVVGSNRYPALSVRIDKDGKLVNNAIKNWDGSKQNSSEVMTQNKIKSILPVEKALAQTKESSKFGFDKDITVSLKWTPNSPGDSLGVLAYQISYDFSRRRYGAYGRQVLIDASTGKFIQEIELASEDMEMAETNKFSENGKFGLRGDGCSVPAIYDEVPTMGSNFMICRKGEFYGVINKKNEVLLPFEYEKLKYYKSKNRRNSYWYLIAEKDGKKGCFERYGDWVLPVEFDSITENEMEELVGVRADGSTMVYDTRLAKIKE